MRDRELQRIATDFRRKMEKLGLGVSMQAGDGPMIEVIPPPQCDGSKKCRAETHIEGCFKSKKPR